MLFGPAYRAFPSGGAIAVPCPGWAAIYPSPSTARKPGSWRGRQHRGAPLAGRVLIVDDVISAGTSVRESSN